LAAVTPELPKPVNPFREQQEKLIETIKVLDNFDIIENNKTPVNLTGMFSYSTDNGKTWTEFKPLYDNCTLNSK